MSENTHNPIEAPMRRPVKVLELEHAAVCDCGATLAPDGTCVEIGSCAAADERATRGAARETAKYAVPAAWSARGTVD